MKKILSVASILLVTFAPCVKAESLDVTEQLALVGGLLACVTLILSSAIVYLFLTVLKVRGQVLEFTEIQQLRLQHLDDGPAVQAGANVPSTRTTVATETDLAAPHATKLSSNADSNQDLRGSQTAVKFARQLTESNNITNQVGTPSGTDSTKKFANALDDQIEHRGAAVRGHQLLTVTDRYETLRRSQELPTLTITAVSKGSNSTRLGSENRYQQPAQGSGLLNPPFSHQSLQQDSNYQDSASNSSATDDPHLATRRSLSEWNSLHSASNRSSVARHNPRHFYQLSGSSKIDDESPYLHRRPQTRNELQFQQPTRRQRNTSEPISKHGDTSSMTDVHHRGVRERDSLSHESERNQRSKTPISTYDEAEDFRRISSEKRKRLSDNVRASSSQSNHSSSRNYSSRY